MIAEGFLNNHRFRSLERAIDDRLEVDHDVSESAHVKVDTSNVASLLSIQDVLVDCVEI